MENKLSPTETKTTNLAAEQSSSDLEAKHSKQVKKLDKLRKKMSKHEELLGSGRGIETMFRNGSRANYQLIAFADNKASIMITVNGFILSVLMASIGNTYNQTPWLVLPSFSFMLTSVISIFYSVLAAYPRVPDKEISMQDVRDMKPDANILFFGTAANMSEDDYLQVTEEMLKDQNFLYRTMALDSRNISKMLLRKFKMLSFAYRVFLFGLTVTLVLAISSYIINT
ncbi:MAG: DUF5706 domain-containing protein [Mariprofundaceae bacterium]|nr:DUF5706 domain-containing protein [Mariprofundaceae bacterium]